jgi:hypothetical protein
MLLLLDDCQGKLFPQDHSRPATCRMQVGTCFVKASGLLSMLGRQAILASPVLQQYPAAGAAQYVNNSTSLQQDTDSGTVTTQPMPLSGGNSKMIHGSTCNSRALAGEQAETPVAHVYCMRQTEAHVHHMCAACSANMCQSSLAMNANIALPVP